MTPDKKLFALLLFVGFGLNSLASRYTGASSYAGTNNQLEKRNKSSLTRFKALSGKVVDEQGAAIPNVCIFIYGTTLGTRSKPDGRFIIEVPKNQEFGLGFTHICYCRKNIPVHSKQVKNELIVVLKAEVDQFDFVRQLVIRADCEPSPKPPIPKLVLEEEREVLIVMERPEFGGGSRYLFKIFNQEKLKIQERFKAKGQELKGIYHGTFVIDKTGAAYVVNINEETSNTCKEVLDEILKAAGKWKPGNQVGKLVDVTYSFVVEF